MGIQSHQDKWRQHQAAASPQQAAHQPPVVTSRASDSPDTPLMLAALENDVQRLHEINSLTRKQEVKRAELLPRYRDYVIRHMTAGKKPGPVLVRVMIWAFDTGDIDYGMRLASYIHAQGGAVMPEGFKRNFPNYVLGTVGDLAVAQMRDKQAVTEYILHVYGWMEDNPQWDIVDKIKSAVLKGLGGYHEEGRPAVALECYEQAQALDAGANLVRKIKQLRGENPA